MRIAKWTAIILGGVVLLLVATVFVVTSVVDPNRYRGKVEAIVANLAGRPFVIQGDLAITWYPWLGIRTGVAHLDNAPGVAGPPLVEWQAINVAAKVWPLLHGEVVADRIRLQSPSIHLRRDKQGRGNWEGLGESHVGGNAAGPPRAAADGSAAATDAQRRDGAQGAAGAGAAGDTGATTAGAGRSRASGGESARGPGGTSAGSTAAATVRDGAGRQVQIAGVEIRDGTVDYVDEATGLQATLSNVELDVGEWRAGKSLPVHTKFLAHTQSLPPNGIWVELDAPDLAVRPSPLAVSAPKLTVKVGNAQADGDLSYEQIADAGASARGSAGTGVAAGGSAGAEVGTQRSTDAGLDAHGSADIGVSAHGSANTDVSAHGSNYAAVGARGAAGAVVSARGSAGAEVTARGSAGSGITTRGSAGTEIGAGDSAGAGVSTRGATGVGPDKPGAADGHVKAHGSVVLRTPSLRELANSLALSQSLPHDPTTLGPLELTTAWTYDDGFIAAKPLALKLDGVNFNGWLQRTAAPKPMWGFELHGDRIDLSRYVSADSQNKKPFELPVEALRAIPANGSLIFDQVVLADTHMADVRLKLQTPEGHP